MHASAVPGGARRVRVFRNFLISLILRKKLTLRDVQSMA